MKVLIACEFSGIVREAFKKRGHDAWSCDLIDTEIPGQHMICDCISILNNGWDLMIAHPPCFAGDTLILTYNGYQKICDVKVGDLVLTHRGRWRKVTKTMNRLVDETLTIKVTGSTPIITTKEHPFYTKYRKWVGTKRTTIKTETGPVWKKAEELAKGCLIGSAIPPESEKEIDYSDEHLWLMGCYVADGYIRYRNNKFEQVSFCIGANKAEIFKNKIKRKCSGYRTKSVVKFSMYGKDFCETFVQFGRSCETKTLPGWVLRLPKRQAAIFLDGYLFGDGCKTANQIMSSSISKKLTLSIAILMRRVYNRPISINVCKRKPTTIIEGRVVNQSIAYEAKFRKNLSKTISSQDGIYIWYPFRNMMRSGCCMVYNLSVEEDESYVVDNCIVHNCTFLTNAGVRHLHENVASKNGKKAKIHGKERWAEMEKACEFFNQLLNAPIPKICVENPIPHKYAREKIGKYTQIIQPWQFGHGETKATCLWLKNLPKLVPTNIVEGRKPRVHYEPPGPNRWKNRSRTFIGIAEAMATQWG